MISLYLDPSPMEVLIKSQLSIYLSVPQFGFSLKNGLLVFFLIFGTMVDNWNILKLTELFFSRKRAQNGSKIGFIVFFSKFLSLVFLVNNLKWKLILLLIFHHQPHMRQNSGFKAALWVCVTRHAQSTQNSYFTWSL